MLVGRKILSGPELANCLEFWGKTCRLYCSWLKQHSVKLACLKVSKGCDLWRENLFSNGAERREGQLLHCSSAQQAARPPPNLWVKAPQSAARPQLSSTSYIHEESVTFNSQQRTQALEASSINKASSAACLADVRSFDLSTISENRATLHRSAHFTPTHFTVQIYFSWDMKTLVRIDETKRCFVRQCSDKAQKCQINVIYETHYLIRSFIMWRKFVVLRKIARI